MGDMLIGQITHIRAISKRLVFIDVRLQEANYGTTTQDQPQHVELIIKQDIIGDVEVVKRARDSCHLGDVIRAVGDYDEHGCLKVTSICHISHWVQGPGNPTFNPDAKSVEWSFAAAAARKKLKPNTITTSNPSTISHQTTQIQSTGKMQACGQNHGTERRQKHGQLASDGEKGLCKFWINTGQCAKGDLCPNVHVQGGLIKEARRKYLIDRREVRAAGAADKGFMVHSGGAAAKRQRAKLFAQWLVDTYGVDQLNQGSGVLDVAGGRGALSFELCVKHGVKVTLVEPRPFKLNRLQYKTLKGLRRATGYETSQATPIDVDAVGQSKHEADMIEHGENSDEEGDDSYRQDEPMKGDDLLQGYDYSQQQVQLAPGMHITQIASWFDERLWQASVQHARQHVHKQVEPAAVANTVQPAQLGKRINVDVAQHGAATSVLPEDVLDTIVNCSIVVGLHPDQATDHIVQFANAMPSPKPFAVVPCCVFPRLFAHRRLRLTASPEDSSQSTKHDKGHTHASSTGGLDGDVPKQEPSRVSGKGWHDSVSGKVLQAGASHDDASMWQAPVELLTGGVAIPTDSSDVAFTGGNQQSYYQSSVSASNDDGDSKIGIHGNAAGMQLDVDDLSVPVVTYPELVQYLQQLGGPGTRTAVLQLIGANQVVYRT